MAMDIKESIISSFFFHVILLLLMLAVSNNTTGSIEDIRNIISIDLTMEDIKDLSDDVPDSADAPPLVSSQSPIEEEGLPDQKESEPAGETIPEPDKKEEAVAEPAKTEDAVIPPAQTEGPPSMEAYYQFITIHKKIFGQKAGARVNQLLGEALKVNTRQFYGGIATVSLKFGPDGKLTEVLVDSASPELKAFFEEIVWDSVPAPAAFFLGFTGVRIEFTVLEGYMSFKLDAL